MTQTYQLYGLTVESTRAFSRPVPSASGSSSLRVEAGPPVPSAAFWPQLEVASSSSPDHAISNTLYRHPEDDICALRFQDAADYVLTPNEISYHLHDSRLEYAVDIWLLGPVFSIWNELRGRPALHAAAVSVGDEAVGILATKKGGKTTLAAALMNAGRPLLTDDVLVLDCPETEITGHPSYPQMRMWPDQAQYFVGDVEALPRVVPHLTKRRVPVGPDTFGEFRTTACPVTHLFLPERRPNATSIRTSRLSPQDAFVELLRHSFLPHTVERLHLADQRLPLLTALSEQVQMHRLIYPEGNDHLPRVAEAILRETA
jgi:hypothetical protein